MENPCKLLLFGDSITKGFAPKIEKMLKFEYPEVDLKVINAGISGETTRDALKRLPQMLVIKPDVVNIGFGMNDWRKGVEANEFKQNIKKMLMAFEDIGSRVVINTVSPSYDFSKFRHNFQVDKYSKCIREIAYENRIKIADINALWKRELLFPQVALRDHIHPNKLGYKIICKSLMWVLPRRTTTVLWQYNGKEAKCNYKCPYCYYVGLHSPKDKFVGSVEEWHSRFKEAFGQQHLVFYLAHGEPTYGEKFDEILHMIESEKNWELRITSNASYGIERLTKSKLATEGRLNINASFHPCMIKRDDFLRQILYLRDCGIEVPIVYVAYPPYLKHFEDDIKFFRKNNFLVHVRRFQGFYRKNLYPNAYTVKELYLIAKYSDSGTIKYMLNQQTYKNELTYAGLHFFIVDNAGNIGYDANIFAPYTKYKGIFGNLHSGDFKPMLLPSPYPGFQVGTVDGIANIVKNHYKEFEGNNVLSFAKQGGVYKDNKGKIVYGNEFMNFNDPKTRANYNFFPRDIKDLFYLGIRSPFQLTHFLKQKVNKASFLVAKKIFSDF